MKLLLTAFALVVLTAPQVAFALTATQSVLKEVRSTTPTGDIITRYVDATLVVPGEVIVYRLDYENDGSEPVTDMVLTMPVPSEVTFQEGSADQDGMETYFSADGGATFHVLGNVMIDALDGTLTPAGAADITHVQWVAKIQIAPNTRGQLQFKAALK